MANPACEPEPAILPLKRMLPTIILHIVLRDRLQGIKPQREHHSLQHWREIYQYPQPGQVGMAHIVIIPDSKIASRQT
jgi:hypothetical protein